VESLSLEVVQYLTAPSIHSNISLHLANTSTTPQSSQRAGTMKTQVIFSALLAGVGLVSAAPTPDKTVEKGVPQVTVTVVPIPLAPYPDSPYTNEFQYINYDDSKDEDKKTRTTIHNAFKD
jgi:hypothetical protein